jgi:hypothetical protein
MAVLDCPTCGAHRDDVPDSYVGKAVKCKACGESVRVPGGEPGPPPSPRPPSPPAAPRVRPLWPLNDDETITARLMLADMAYNQRAIRGILVVGRYVVLVLFILFVVWAVGTLLMRNAAKV